jgi:hypothetical protein
MFVWLLLQLNIHALQKTNRQQWDVISALNKKIEALEATVKAVDE